MGVFSRFCLHLLSIQGSVFALNLQFIECKGDEYNFQGKIFIQGKIFMAQYLLSFWSSLNAKEISLTFETELKIIRTSCVETGWAERPNAFPKTAAINCETASPKGEGREMQIRYTSSRRKLINCEREHARPLSFPKGLLLFSKERRAKSGFSHFYGPRFTSAVC